MCPGRSCRTRKLGRCNTDCLNILMELIVKLIVSYFLGSVSGSMLMGKLKGVDIREMGSGNAGGTNAFRTQGALFALGVMTIDILKGFIPTKFIPDINFPFLYGIGIDAKLFIILCGIAAILGHVYPVYHRFRGGKGGGAAIGMILAIYYPVILIALLLWILIVILTGFVGLGTIISSIVVVCTAYFFMDSINNPYFFPFSILLCLFIIYTHRSNIRRMLNGNENRFEKAMIFRKNT